MFFKSNFFRFSTKALNLIGDHGAYYTKQASGLTVFRRWVV